MKREKENILSPQVDLQPVIKAFHFLLRQLSRLLPFPHPLLVFPLLFGDNVAYDNNGFESSRTASYADTNEDTAFRLPGKPGDTGVPAKPPGPGQKPGMDKPQAPPINTQRFHQDQKNREEISTPGHTLLIEPHIHSMRFLTTYARDNFPGFDSFSASLPALELKQEQPGMDAHSHKYQRKERHPTGDFKGNRGGLSLPMPVIGIANRHTTKIKESGTVMGQQNLFVPVPNRGIMGSKESGVIKTFKNVRFVNCVVQEAQNQKQKQNQQTWPVIMIPCLLNVPNQEKNSPESTFIDENKQEYGIGLPSLYAVNRSLGFLNEVAQPPVVQVRLEEKTKAISYPAAEKVHINHENFLSARGSSSETKFTSIREIQEKAGSQNTFQTSVEQAIPYVPMPAKHFLETRRVDSAAGASGMFVRMRTYNIAPSLTSLAFAGNYLQTRLMSSMSWNSYSGNVLSGVGPRLFQRVLSGEKPTARRAVKSFSGGPGPTAWGGEAGAFAPSSEPLIADLQLPVSSIHHSSFIIQNSSFINAPLAAGGTLSPLLKSLSICNDYIQAHLLNPVSRNSYSLQSHQHNHMKTPQLRAAEELHRHVHGYGHELSTTVIVEKIYKTQFTDGTRGSDAGLNFRESRDNQKQEVTNTFNVTMNVDNAFPGAWDPDSLQDLSEKLTELLRDEAQRYGIKT
jgi:hypothetical protein